MVDAGGKGFLVILQGMLDEIRGVPMPQSEQEEESTPADKAVLAAMATEDITFAFDTVFIVRKHTENVDLDPFRKYLNSIGDSLVIGEDDEASRSMSIPIFPARLSPRPEVRHPGAGQDREHAHPGRRSGAGKHVQSTDDLEAIEAELEAGCAQSEPVKAAPEKKYGYVAVCAGAGLESVFKDLGVDGVISGGQTMNPPPRIFFGRSTRLLRRSSSCCPTTKISSWPPSSVSGCVRTRR